MRRFVVAALLAALILPSAATAAGVKVGNVDPTGYPRVRVTVVTPEQSKNPPVLTENGKAAAGVQAQNLGRAKSIVLAIDRSQSMRGKPLDEAVAAARAFIEAKPPADRIAVTTFATKALMLTDFSSATIDADNALRGIEVDPVQGTKLYDDLVLAARSLAKESLEGRVIIAVTDGNETRSKAGLADVVAAARKARALIYVVAIESSRFTPEPLKQIAAQTGGEYYGAASSEALTGVYAAIARELKRTWTLEYLSAGQAGERQTLSVSVPGQGSAMVEFRVPAGAGIDSESKSLLPKPFYQPWGVLLLSLTVGLLVLVGLALVLSSGPDRLVGRLRPHLASGPAAAVQAKRGARDRLQALAGLFRATERAFGQTRHWLKIQRLLERADIPLKTVEFVYIMLGSGFGLALLAAFAGQPPIVILGCIPVGGLIPFLFLGFKARRRLNAFENQLPDLLISIAASLKAGHSFRQAIQVIVDEGYEPAGKELGRVLAETQLGRPMEAALADMAERVGSKNFSFIITAVTIQNQVGGSLAGIFDMVGDTVRSRHQFARKVKALTAMGRASAYVLVAMPFALAGLITLLNRDYMDPLYHSSIGHKMIISGLVMIVIGSLFIKKIVSFKG